MKRTSALNAVIYSRFSSNRNAQRFSGYEVQKGVLYCDLHEYSLCAVLQSVGSNTFNDSAINEIIRLAERGMLDVLVLTSVAGFFHHQVDALRFFDKLYSYRVKVDYVGCGSLDRKMYSAYIIECENNEREFQEILNIFVEPGG